MSPRHHHHSHGSSSRGQLPDPPDRERGRPDADTAYQARVEAWLAEQANLEDGLVGLFKRLDAAERGATGDRENNIELSVEDSMLFPFPHQQEAIERIIRAVSATWEDDVRRLLDDLRRYNKGGDLYSEVNPNHVSVGLIAPRLKHMLVTRGAAT